MFENTVIKEVLPEDMMGDSNIYKDVYSKIVNELSENQFTISQVRHLFNSILERFEREMPVTNHIKRL